MTKKRSTPAKPEETAKADTGMSRTEKRVVAGVAGIAVGSAAIAAALLFAGRSSKPKSAAIQPPPPNTPLPATSVQPDASIIEVAKAD